MAIAEKDIKLLWGRAGGRCSKPGCTEDLTALTENGGYTVGEMAHVIGRKPNARRGVPQGGADIYDNLILLCPLHHRHIDKAPEDTFPSELLHEWKRQHEETIRRAGSTQRFERFEDLKASVSRILASNKVVFSELGPRSKIALRDPSSNLCSVWDLRRLDRILPNNRKIVNLIDANIHLLPINLIEVFERFRTHAGAYERHVYHPLDSYPLYPQEFGAAFS
jgi:hypothetical protein